MVINMHTKFWSQIVKTKKIRQILRDVCYESRTGVVAELRYEFSK